MTDREFAKVVFTPSGKRGEIQIGKSVLAAAQQLGVDLDTVCGGRGICDRCQIDLSVGDFPKFQIQSKPEHLSEHTSSEEAFFLDDIQPTRRLGCQALLQGDVVIDIPPESQAHRQIVRKRLDVHKMTVNPAVRLHYVEVQEPDMHEPSGDLERTLDALEFEWGLSELKYDYAILGVLQQTLREGQWKITVAVHQEQEIIAIWSGFQSIVYGVSIDVGSTTIAAHLYDLISGEAIASTGRMNPQIRFGEDLMSRVSYVMMNPGGEVDMTRTVREALQGQIADLCKIAKIETVDILDMSIVGNPIMHHLLLGVNPIELGGAPFALATDHAIRIKASDIDIQLHPGARTYVLPCIAGHVGADAAAATLSEAPYQQDELTLLVDVGTNAEIVLGNRSGMLAASSPTGPAFEGAQISSGQRAAPGAIERVRIDAETFEPRFQVIGCELWSDEEDFFDKIENTGITGICGSGIIEVIAEMFLCGIILHNGNINGELAKRTDRIIQDGKTWSYMLFETNTLRILITQNDVRAIQLAKAALYAGARLLMDKMGVNHVDRIRLAGAFGAHIDVKYAMVLGMIPDCDLSQVSSAGNAAGKGASIALLDVDAREEIEHTVNQIQKIETAVEEKFQEYFVGALGIPHATDQFEKLAKQVKLPQIVDKPITGQSVSDQRRRRRKRS
ncbi:MAG: ASKHA domain-containing protein [Gammaproteobacteria bacterium]|nr:ASKHA domain-containing protein [Gammaproteobacteria bacterium]MCY4219751.1 ASKHA domain-containing protein [Gammaproteobacteria bacterium]